MPVERRGAPPLVRGSLVATDFDGTLAPIVDDPAASRPIDGAVEVLAELASRGHEVAVVSGRPLSFLVEHLPEQLTLVGLYGLEMRRGGELVEHPDAEEWRATMRDVAQRATDEGPEGMLVESKGLSITLHYRTRPELAEQVDAFAADAARAAGLEVRAARRSVELHPPIDEDKGTALAAPGRGIRRDRRLPGRRRGRPARVRRPGSAGGGRAIGVEGRRRQRRALADAA